MCKVVMLGGKKEEAGKVDSQWDSDIETCIYSGLSSPGLVCIAYFLQNTS